MVAVLRSPISPRATRCGCCLDDHLLGVGRVKDGFMTPETVLTGSVEELLAR